MDLELKNQSVLVTGGGSNSAAGHVTGQVLSVSGRDGMVG
jgi:hypothetical protein